jgi:hypothetical protein
MNDTEGIYHEEPGFSARNLVIIALHSQFTVFATSFAEFYLTIYYCKSNCTHKYKTLDYKYENFAPNKMRNTISKQHTSQFHITKVTKACNILRGKREENKTP